MPSLFPVFSGLGSVSIFSEENLQRAEKYALRPECAVVLQSCHRTFHEQISYAIGLQILSKESIDLDDFVEIENLIRPASKYHQNVIIQHTTLYLHQILAYITTQNEVGEPIGSAGFCTGLLAAAVASASQSSVISLISQSHNFFLLALWIGIRSEGYRVDNIATAQHNSDESSLVSCSYVLEGMSEDAAKESLGRNGMVSARSSAQLIARIDS